jgi:hypothetical protein
MSLILSGSDGLSDIDGSASTPAIRGTDANTGIFFGADIIGFAEGGAECARFNADAQFVAAAGTALLPVITTTGDVNTGIFFPAADTIAFSEGGAEAMRIDSSGNLLVGTTNMGQGVGVQVGEVGIDGVSGFGMTSAVSIADDATITLSANTGLLVFIEYVSGGVYPGAMFYCSYAAGVVLVTQSGGSFAATDSDGNACVFKSNATDVVTVKNRLGGTRSYSIHTLQLRGQ